VKTLRTPDARFESLDGYRFAPHYVELDDQDGGRLRMHYVDEGPPDGQPVVLLHGEPTWSYLYRKMIPGLVERGFRVLAADLVGFGRSDKPTEQSDYSVARHFAWTRVWIQTLDLRNALFFGQDWGSLIGLSAVLHEEPRFVGIAVGNAVLPDPAHMERMQQAGAQSPDPEAFSRWQAYAASVDRMGVGRMLAEGLPGVGTVIALGLSPAEQAAYDAPFPDPSYQAGALVFPQLIKPEHLGAEGVKLFRDAWRVLEKWEKPFVTAYGKKDPVLGYFDSLFQKFVPGAKGQKHREFPNAGHFVQEQEAEGLVEAIAGLRAD
jgi:haloalkane dehalogenase